MLVERNCVDFVCRIRNRAKKKFNYHKCKLSELYQHQSQQIYIFIIAMKDDLLILKLLKVPVTIIKYCSKFVAMLTYLPNYLIILILDAIIFHASTVKSLLNYIIFWPIRLASLLAVIAIFSFEFYGLYSLLSIQHFHWGIQLTLSFVAFQGVLALMRHGYLTMIKKYSPTKLKSPLQHLQQLWYMLTDIIGLILAVINAVLIINILNTLNYTYIPDKPYNFIKHILKLIHRSVLDIIKLFYIKIFFRIFPWRYQHSINEVHSQENNILHLTVLLTLLFLQTNIDLITFIIFGGYCRILHPRRSVYAKNLRRTHQKFKVTLKFVFNSLIQIGEILILLFCLPFKFSYSKQVLSLILHKNNDYSFHYIQQTFFVLKLALVKIPALLCELILLIFYYKHKKIASLKLQKLMKQKDKEDVAQTNSKVLFKPKIKADSDQQQEQQLTAGKEQENKKKQLQNKQKKYWETTRLSERQFLVFQCFGSLLKEIPFYPLVFISSALKIWNISWLKYLIDENHDMRITLVLEYCQKSMKDYINVIPGIISILLLGLYDPVKQKQILQKAITNRSAIRQKLPNAKADNISINNLQFYRSTSAIMPVIVKNNFKQIGQDLFFLPLFFGFRLSLLSLIGCQRPYNSVQTFQQIWMQFYIARVKRSAYYAEYLQFQKIDMAAGMIKNQRQRLRFWKFAHKSVRHRLISKIISFLLPKRRAQKAIDNAEICRNLSAISNHYWHRYNITMNLLKYLIFFVIQIIITLFGVIILMPLTLWRMPTFLILFRTHQYKKSMFFKILFPMYKQMIFDIITIPVKIITLILFPRASISFYYKTAFRYTSLGIQSFQKVQNAKKWFIANKILIQGLFLYMLFWKICFVKFFWVRKRDMNSDLKNKNIRLSTYLKDFLLTPQSTPIIVELLQLYQKQKLKVSLSSMFAQPQQKSKKLKDINQRGKQIEEIVNKYFSQTIEDIPYLMIMIVLIFTLPWRVFYIRNALFSMRDDKIHRGQFVRLIKLVAKDYQCIVLYVLLIMSIVKARRAITLFYRNFKINFYVGILRYSHLQELRSQLREAVHFYKSIIILIAACCFGPYRTWATYMAVKNLYKRYCEEIQLQQTNKRIYENTIKQGKSLQLLTKIGNNTLQHVFRFLDTKQLTKMTRVCRYMYETIKQRDEVWADQWDRVYSTKYPNLQIKNQNRGLSYNQMCIKVFKQENGHAIKEDKDRFYNLAIKQFNTSAFETALDIKVELQKFLPQPIFRKIFSCLRWTVVEGYGPQQTWPRADDNPELIQMLNIQRRQIDELSEPQAAVSWLFQRPVQFIMIRLNRFYGVDSHRRKKQFVYSISLVAYPLFLLFVVVNAWGWFWQFTMFMGYKLLLAAYLITFHTLLFTRCNNQKDRTWVALNPFDLIDDVIYYLKAFADWIQRKSSQTKQFVKQKGNRYIVQPVKRVFNYFKNKAIRVGQKALHYGNLFYQKVAKPLYISLSHKIAALWQVIKDVASAISQSVKKLLLLIKQIVKGVYNFLFSIVKSISNLYSNFLEHFLRVSLKFGTLGQLVFTIVILAGMVSPSVYCYFYYFQRWFIIFSSLASLVLVVTGYKHLNRIKDRVLRT